MTSLSNIVLGSLSAMGILTQPKENITVFRNFRSTLKFDNRWTFPCIVYTNSAELLTCFCSFVSLLAEFWSSFFDSSKIFSSWKIFLNAFLTPLCYGCTHERRIMWLSCDTKSPTSDIYLLCHRVSCVIVNPVQLCKLPKEAEKVWILLTICPN